MCSQHKPSRLTLSRLKALESSPDGNGFCIWQKKLEQGKFYFPSNNTKEIELTGRELIWLISGIDLFSYVPEGAETSAFYYSLLQSFKANGLNVILWLSKKDDIIVYGILT